MRILLVTTVFIVGIITGISGFMAYTLLEGSEKVWPCIDDKGRLAICIKYSFNPPLEKE